MNITKEQNTAAGEIVELIASSLGDNRQIHPPTAISAGARLSGSFLFRSFNLKVNDIKPGTVVLSEEANQKGPMLFSVLGGTLANFGLNLDHDAISKASKADPTLSFVETMEKLQDSAHEIMNRNKLNQEQMAVSCAMATAFIIKECQVDLAPASAFNTAMFGFMDGTKTYPPALGGKKPEGKSFFKFWK